MTTKYKHIYFTSEQDIVDDTAIWYCRNRRTDDILGKCLYFPKWKRWVFEADPGCVFDHNCLRDVIDFLQKQLGGV